MSFGSTNATRRRLLLTNQLGPIAHSNDIGAEEDVEPDEKRQD
jgi:hypothetical protein